MDIKQEQVLSKTLKGIDAARSGGGISSRLQSALKLVDGVKNVADQLEDHVEDGREVGIRPIG